MAALKPEICHDVISERRIVTTGYIFMFIIHHKHIFTFILYSNYDTPGKHYNLYVYNSSQTHIYIYIIQQLRYPWEALRSLCL